MVGIVFFFWGGGIIFYHPALKAIRCYICHMLFIRSQSLNPTYMHEKEN